MKLNLQQGHFTKQKTQFITVILISFVAFEKTNGRQQTRQQRRLFS